MRQLFLFVLTSTLVIASALQAGAIEIKYKSAGLRDPFADPSDEKPTDDFAKIEAGLRSLLVQGVIVSGNNKSAIINNAIYKIGDKVGAAEVADIDRDGVFILYNGKEIKLQLIKRKLSNEKKAAPALTASQK